MTEAAKISTDDAKPAEVNTPVTTPAANKPDAVATPAAAAPAKSNPLAQQPPPPKPASAPAAQSAAAPPSDTVAIEREEPVETPAGDAPQTKTNGKADFTQDAMKFMRKGADSLRKGAEGARKGANALIEKSRKISVQTPSWAAEPFRGTKTFTPRADFSMGASSYEIAIELPGLEERDVHVKLSDGQIAVSGEKLIAAESNKSNTYFMQERQFGRFERKFRMPNDVDPAKIDARFERNVLKIKLPKYPEATVPEREIEVKAG